MVADGPGNSGNLPPPFLIKTYEMVDDPSTDCVVSWSDNNCSFVVWNVADFTKDLLPQYFKHNNFSSFVRQLNTYGFHKIDPERQEFANEGFSKGNKENLKNIHRRKPCKSNNHSQSQNEHNLTSCHNPAHVGLDEEVGRLQKEKGVLFAELLKVKQQQEGTELELESLGNRLQALEERQQQMMAFLAQVIGNPAGTFAKRVHKLQTYNKRRRLLDKEVVIGVGESWEDDEGGRQLYWYHSDDAADAVSSADMMKTELDTLSYEQVLRRFAGSTLNHSNETSPMSRTSGITLWEIPTTVNADSAGSGLPATCGTLAECCNPNSCKITTCEEHNRAASPGTLHDDQAQVPDQCKGREDMQLTNIACGSNDVFWENLLTENPRLSDKDVDEPDDARRNERWFL